MSSSATLGFSQFQIISGIYLFLRNAQKLATFNLINLGRIFNVYLITQTSIKKTKIFLIFESNF